MTQQVVLPFNFKGKMTPAVDPEAFQNLQELLKGRVESGGQSFNPLLFLDIKVFCHAAEECVIGQRYYSDQYGVVKQLYRGRIIQFSFPTEIAKDSKTALESGFWIEYGEAVLEFTASLVAEPSFQLAGGIQLVGKSIH